MKFHAAVQPYLCLSADEQEERGVDAARNLIRQRTDVLQEIKKIGKKEFGSDHVGAEKEGDCFCRYIVDRVDLLDDLQDFAVSSEGLEAEAVCSGKVQSRFNHLVMIQSNSGFYLPNYFFFPTWVRSRKQVYPIFVGSAPRLLEELAIVDEALGASKTTQLARMPDFLRADRDQIEDYEYSFGSEDHFWERFAFSLLRRLAQIGVQQNMPVIIG
ncbi:MAG: hypothetical protein QF752_04445 [Planctomycetota bacterium]|jgi:hypothetical protein|nr:hypothetical protein [Planctomycetota bacterium]